VAALLTFQVEPCRVLAQEGRALMREHWEELGKEFGFPEPDPDERFYFAAEAAGKFVCVTARCEGSLVGYFTAMIGQNRHYKTIRVGLEDGYFIHPVYRDYRNARGLIEATKAALRERGVDKMIVRSKVTHSTGPLLERLGFRPIDLSHIIDL
jgi:hypothetical protein